MTDTSPLPATSAVPAGSATTAGRGGDPVPPGAGGMADPPGDLGSLPAEPSPDELAGSGTGYPRAGYGGNGLDEAGHAGTGYAEPAGAGSGPEAPAARDEELLVQEGDVAGDYLERLLDIADYDGDIDLDVEGDRAIVAIVGGDLQQLVGPSGLTLEALQELTRLAVQQRTGVRSRLMLDIDGYRSRRRAELAALARTTAAKVLSAGDPVRLVPMNPFERKVVHDVITELDGVCSESEGEEPQRCVVVSPDG